MRRSGFSFCVRARSSSSRESNSRIGQILSRSGLVGLAGLIINLHLIAAQPAWGAGVFEDPARLGAFVRVPAGGAVESQASWSDGPYGEASLFLLAGYAAVRSSIVLRAELIYAAVAEDADVETGFGDFRVRVRVPLLRNPGWTVSLVGGGRMGAGKVSLFPYSTSSIDVEGGLAAIDTLRSVALWAMTTGTIVTRVAEVLDRDDGHQNYLTAAGGAAWDPKGWFSVNGGAVAYFLRGGATRSEVFLSPEAVTGGGISVFVTTVIETGADEDRAVDVAVSLGLHARY